MAGEANYVQLDKTYEGVDGIGVREEEEDVRAVYADLVGRVERFLEEKADNDLRRGTQLKVQESLQIIRKALHDYGYRSPSHTLLFEPILTRLTRFDPLALSFNGGKDCLVLLLLYIYILSTTHFPP